VIAGNTIPAHKFGFLKAGNQAGIPASSSTGSYVEGLIAISDMGLVGLRRRDDRKPLPW